MKLQVFLILYKNNERYFYSCSEPVLKKQEQKVKVIESFILSTFIVMHSISTLYENKCYVLLLNTLYRRTLMKAFE